MFIFLSGVESVNKKFLAKNIKLSLNKVIIDGYTIKIDNETYDYEILDKDKKKVDITTFFKNEKSKKTLDKISKVVEDITIINIQKNHLLDKYEAIDFELGITNIPRYLTDNRDFKFVKYDISPATILNNYANNKQKYFIITGSISKTFIDTIISKIGKENVIIYNIIRNPSVSFLLNNKSEMFFNENKTYTKQFDSDKLRDSFVNAMLLKEHDDVITIRYEDILENGFEVNSEKCVLPSYYDKFNKYLSYGEYERILDVKITEEELKEFNEIFKNYSLKDFIDETDLLILKPEEIEKINNYSKAFNIFERLGYEELTIEEIGSLQS